MAAPTGWSRSVTPALAAALRAQGVHVETRIYEGRGHVDLLAAPSLPARARAPVVQDIAAFMLRLGTTGGSSAPFSAAAAPLGQLSPPRT